MRVPVYKPGEELTVQKKVSESDTAINYGSGQLETLFATPSLVGLMIEASTRLLDGQLDEGFITVGKSVEIIHEQPTIQGQTVSVKVIVEECVGNVIKLNMEAYDEIGLVGRGKHERVVVNKASLLHKANARAESISGINV